MSMSGFKMNWGGWCLLDILRLVVGLIEDFKKGEKIII